MLSCKNCGTNFDGNYCPNCSQKYIDKRFTIKESILWAFHSIFNFDKGFLLTSKELIVKPGIVINDFINGVTVRYAHPFRFVFIWASLAAIIGVWAGTYQETSATMNEVMGVSKSAIENSKQIQEFMGKYMSFVMVLMIPFYAIGSYLLFKSQELNYAEHLIANSFAFSSSIMIGIPLTLVYGFYPEMAIINLINIGIGVLVLSRIYSQTFKTSFIEGFAKYLLTFLLAIILITITTIIVMILAFIVMHLLGVENPFVPSKAG